MRKPMQAAVLADEGLVAPGVECSTKPPHTYPIPAVLSVVGADDLVS